MLSLDEVRNRVDTLFPAVTEQLVELLGIPSVNAEEKHRADVIAAGIFTQELLEEAGLKAEIVRAPRPDGTVGAPAVLARTDDWVDEWPTVLLYAHHDVQPVTGQEGWDANPFGPVFLDQEEAGATGLSSGPRGRLVARGTADDKGGVIAHAAAIRALAADRKVNLAVLIEGEEEIGSPSMPALIEQYREVLTADAVIVIDGNMWRVDVPMMTASMRGLLVGDVTVEAFESGLHSGGYGGPVLDANVLAARLIATLHDEDGSVAVAGLDTGVAPQSRGAAVDPEFFRHDATLLEESQLTGAAEGSAPGPLPLRPTSGAADPDMGLGDNDPAGSVKLAEQLWVRPSISVIGIDATPTEAAAGVLAPSTRFRLSLRLPPDLEPVEAERALVQHLEANRPFGAKVTFEHKQAAKGYLLDLESPAAERLRAALEDSWENDSVAAGVGGTVPLLSMLDRSFPGTAILKVGTGDPDSKPHGQNESASLDVLHNLIVALVLFLDRTGAQAK